jgi:hypothetical protein
MTRRFIVMKLYGDDWQGSIHDTVEHTWSGQFGRDDFIRCFLCRRQVRCRDCPRSINLWNDPDAWHRWDKVGGGGFACDQCVARSDFVAEVERRAPDIILGWIRGKTDNVRRRRTETGWSGEWSGDEDDRPF